MAFEEVPIDCLADYASLFPGPQSALLMQAVSAGNTLARLWISGGVRRPDVAVLWDFGNKGLYVGGAASHARALSDLRSFVLTDLAAIARSAGLEYASVRALTPQLVAAVDEALGEMLPESCTELFHELTAGPEAATIATPVDLQFADIDRSLLDSGMANSEQIIEEIKWMWPSVDRFLAQGWGIAAIDGGRVLCWCTAEYVGPSRCGIGIETMDDCQNKGIATAVAKRFIEESAKHGRNPCWECDSGNAASLRVAEKLGFRMTESTNWRIGRW